MGLRLKEVREEEEEALEEHRTNGIAAGFKSD